VPWLLKSDKNSKKRRDLLRNRERNGLLMRFGEQSSELEVDSTPTPSKTVANLGIKG